MWILKKQIINYLLTILFTIISHSLLLCQDYYQIAPGKYWVEFEDKNNNTFSINQPHEFLSNRAIERRNRQGISITLNDLPVSNSYISTLQDIGVQVITTSKWLNGAVIATDDTDLLDSITNLSFVAQIATPNNSESQTDSKIDKKLRNNKFLEFNSFKDHDYYNYGIYAKKQINMHHGEELHNAGYRGQDILIAILDGGFFGLYNTNNLSFDSIIANGQIKFARDFVEDTNIVNVSSTHGMSVLSIICANISGTFIGSAPEADFALIRTEDASAENIIEEIFWAAGAEYADSIGADIINVSLGYTDYDIPEWNHTNQDLDGNTTWISKAANIAAEKGMLVVVAAGNNGTSPPPNLGAPADSYNVLSVGALQADSIFADFSSQGPTADGRFKPEVMSVGKGTYLQHNNATGFGNGTSFSTPIITGLAACLWQANKNASSYEIMDAIISSANLFYNPNDSLGYGIPDFNSANKILKDIEKQKNESDNQILAFPNPFAHNLILRFNQTIYNKVNISIYNVTGQILFCKNYNLNNLPTRIIRIDDLKNEINGIYILKVETKDDIFTTKIIKTE